MSTVKLEDEHVILRLSPSSESQPLDVTGKYIVPKLSLQLSLLYASIFTRSTFVWQYDGSFPMGTVCEGPLQSEVEYTFLVGVLPAHVVYEDCP